MAGDSLEFILRRDRRVAIASLVFVAGLAWAYTLAGAALPPVESGMADMAGQHRDMMPPAMTWTPSHALLMVFMWWIMMIAMMLPGAAPTILLFTAIGRKRQEAGNPLAPTGIFLAGYLAIWGAFSVIATGAQWALDAAGRLSAMAMTDTLLAGSILLAAGLYQFTALKQTCLKRCRGPVEFLVGHWRPGVDGAWRMGLVHGTYCLGCCWFLMALLFIGGIMNVLWIAGLAAYVLFEKTMPAGHWLSRMAGALLVLAGAGILAGA